MKTFAILSLLALCFLPGIADSRCGGGNGIFSRMAERRQARVSGRIEASQMRRAPMMVVPAEQLRQMPRQAPKQAPCPTSCDCGCVQGGGCVCAVPKQVPQMFGDCANGQCGNARGRRR